MINAENSKILLKSGIIQHLTVNLYGSVFQSYNTLAIGDTNANSQSSIVATGISPGDEAYSSGGVFINQGSSTVSPLPWPIISGILVDD